MKHKNVVEEKFKIKIKIKSRNKNSICCKHEILSLLGGTHFSGM
jgi:hypothetical protein